jgi:hypothetical protein
LAAQGLTDPLGTDAVDAVRHLLAVQAQDPTGARLAIRARTVGLTVADVDGALDAGHLVVSWLHRGTLHLVTTEDHWWLHGLLAGRQLKGNERRLRQEGVDDAQAERGVAIVAEAVRDRGPQTRRQLGALLDSAGVPTCGQALVHVLYAASLAGHIVRGPIIDGSHAFVDAVAWCGERFEVDPVEALARLARRYLTAHGPAAPEDLAKWTGLPLGAARGAFTSIEQDTELVGDGTTRLANASDATTLPRPRLLGPFDPVLHGWASRAFVVGDHQGVVTSNGIFRRSVLVEGRVVGLWSLRRGGVELRPLERIGGRTLARLEAEVADVQRFLGREVTGTMELVDPSPQDE